MTIEEIDRTLRRLRGAAEAVGANLLEVELDPARKLLDATALTGESATRWAQASATQTQLWQWCALLEGFLERVVQLRGTRARLPADRLAELSALLGGASIELSSERVPLGQRDLLGESEATLRCTPNELLARMSVAFDESKTVLAAIGTAWETFAPRLHDARARLEADAELARTLGEAEPQDLELARRRITELIVALSSDPLSANAENIEALEGSQQAIRRDLGSIEKVSRELPRLLADARSLLVELQDTARDGGRAHREALVKILAPAGPEPLSIEGALEVNLEEVAELARAGAWREARTALEQWSARARSLLEQARRIVLENRAPIEARNELRGLLDAYQAKAKRMGLIEDLELSGMFDEAHAALYTAPTDLARAAERLERYQQALAENPPARELLR